MQAMLSVNKKGIFPNHFGISRSWAWEIPNRIGTYYYLFVSVFQGSLEHHFHLQEIMFAMFFSSKLGELNRYALIRIGKAWNSEPFFVKSFRMIHFRVQLREAAVWTGMILAGRVLLFAAPLRFGPRMAFN